METTYSLMPAVQKSHVCVCWPVAPPWRAGLAEAVLCERNARWAERERSQKARNPTPCILRVMQMSVMIDDHNCRAKVRIAKWCKSDQRLCPWVMKHCGWFEVLYQVFGCQARIALLFFFWPPELAVMCACVLTDTGASVRSLLYPPLCRVALHLAGSL